MTRFLLIFVGRWTFVVGRHGVTSHYGAKRTYGFGTSTFGRVDA